jgi:hypothetical protein
MTGRVQAARILLRAYPADWRDRYGEELATILEGRSLTPPIVFDVLRNGLLQRIRGAEAWQTGGIVLSTWLVVGTALNSVRPFPRWAYDLFWQFDICIVMAIGYLSVSRDGKSLLAAAVATGKAALVGVIPELFLGGLWMAGLVHPTILQPNGSPMILGHGITELCIRAGVAVPPTHMLLVPLAAVIPSAVAGALGAMTARFVSAFWEGLRPGNIK